MAEDNKGRWQEFNFIVDAEDLDLKEKGLLLIIFRYVNYKTGYADPSRTLIKKLTGISDNRTLDKMFDSLIKKRYLIRESGQGIRSKYFIKVGGEITPSVKITPSVILAESRCNSCNEVGGKITPQKEKKKKIKEIIYIDLKFIDDVIDKVKITQEQYNKLIKKFGKNLVHKNIIELDNYIANGKGNKYKDHHRALNNWCNKDEHARGSISKKDQSTDSWAGMKEFN